MQTTQSLLKPKVVLFPNSVSFWSSAIVKVPEQVGAAKSARRKVGNRVPRNGLLFQENPSEQPNPHSARLGTGFPGRGSQARFPGKVLRKRFPSGFPGRDSQARFPSKVPRKRFPARFPCKQGSPARLPGTGSQARFPARGSQAGFPGRGYQEEFSGRGSQEQIPKQGFPARGSQAGFPGRGYE